MRVLTTLFVMATVACCFGGTQVKPLAGSDAFLLKPTRLGPYQFTLTSARFDTRVVTKEDTYIAGKGKKFLVLTFMVQNPGKTDVFLERQSLSFTVVGADNNNYEFEASMVSPEKLVPVSLNIVPAQKVPAMVFIQVPGDDPIYKVIVRKGESPVLRYDLRGKVAKSDSMFADKTGVALGDSASAKIGQKIEMGYFNLTVDSVDESLTAIGSKSPDEGKKLVVLHVTFTNPSYFARTVERSTYKWEVLDENGENMEFSEDLIKASSNDTIADNLEPTRALRGRLIYYAPKASKPTTVVVHEPEGRSVTISLKQP